MAGRVHVYARARPMVEREAGERAAVAMDSSGSRCAVHYEDEAAKEQVLAGKMAAADVRQQTKDFEFDGVFDDRHGQRDVYDTVGAPVLKDVLRGYNGCIFAYGQTGAGKTHSLLNAGTKEDTQAAGMLPRLVASLYVAIASDPGSVYTVECAMLQVYNEQVDDLLCEGHKQGKGHNLSLQSAGEVAGLTWHTCSQPDQLLRLFAKGRQAVAYAETKMNKASSRSHAVMQLKIMRRPRSNGTPSGGAAKSAQSFKATFGKLSVVDLAGSERVKRSGVRGQQFKEAAAINGSLLALGNVIGALAAKKKHVPYRDSKLTRILQDSVGGNSKTSLLICLSPAADSVSETLSTLEFGSRAMAVELTATVNECVIEVDADQLAADLAEEGLNAAMMAKQKELLAMQKSFADKEKVRQKELAAIKAKADREAKDTEKANSERESLLQKWQAKAKEAQAAMKAKDEEVERRLKEAEARVAEAARGAQAQKQLEANNKQMDTLRKAVAKMEQDAADAKAKHQAELKSAVSAATKKSASASESMATKLALAEEALEEEREKARLTNVELCEARACAGELKAELKRAHARAEDVEAHAAAAAIAASAIAKATLEAASEEARAAMSAANERTAAALATERASAAAALEDERERSAKAAAAAESTVRELWAKVEQAAAAGRAEAEALSARAAEAAVAAEERQRVAVSEAEEAAKAAVEAREKRITALEGALAQAESSHAATVRDMRERADEREREHRAELEREQQLASARASETALLHREELALSRSTARAQLSEAESRAKVSVKRMSVAFSAARALLDNERAEAIAAREALQRRFDARESRADDVCAIRERDAELKRERMRTRKALAEVQQLQMVIHNNAQVDHIFANGVQHKKEARRAGALRTTLQVRRQQPSDLLHQQKHYAMHLVAQQQAREHAGGSVRWAPEPPARASLGLRPSSAFANSRRSAPSLPLASRPTSAVGADRLPQINR